MGASMLVRRVLLSRAGVALAAASVVGITASTVVVRSELAPFTPGVRSVVLPPHGPSRAIVGPEVGLPAPIRLAGGVSTAGPAAVVRGSTLTSPALRPAIAATVASAFSAAPAAAKPVVTESAAPTTPQYTTTPQYATAATNKARAAPKPPTHESRHGHGRDVGRVSKHTQHGKRG